jgi:thioredoxin-dependent peroxiredoxin
MVLIIMQDLLNQPAPQFTLPDQNGKPHSLADYRGRWVLLYFYPKDMTPGCTTEACEIRDSFGEFGKHNAIVFGVSADSVESHKKFAQKHQLPFDLLSDATKQVVESYGVFGKKSFLGKTFMGVHRISFLIDPEGTIKKIYEKVKPKVHAREVLEDLRQFQEG